MAHSSGSTGRVDTRRHAGQAVSSESAIGGVRPKYRQIGHAVAKLKAAHAIPELIDFPDDIIAQHKRRPAAHRLRVEAAPDHHVGVLQTRGEHVHSHLAPLRSRQGSVDHLQPVGTAEAPDLNNPVARLSHGRIPWRPMIQLTARKGRSRCQVPLSSTRVFCARDAVIPRCPTGIPPRYAAASAMPRGRDRWFESCSLQPRVRSELLPGRRSRGTAMARVACSPSQGSMIPFAATEAERQRSGDPRPSPRLNLPVVMPRPAIVQVTPPGSVTCRETNSFVVVDATRPTPKSGSGMW